MVAGPYTAGAKTEAEREANLRFLNEIAVEVFRLGHIPVIGINNALPMIMASGSETFDELMMPMSLALADRCDAVLRVGGASRGADDEVERIQAAGKSVFRSLDEIP